MSEIVTKPDHGFAVGKTSGEDQQEVLLTIIYQNFLDDLIDRLNSNVFGESLRLMVYTVATLPDVPVATEPGLIFVSDETGGAIPAFSDGTDWRRVTDRAVVS